MKRYQVYLNPQTVSIFDAFAEETDLPRSSLIRMAMDTLAATFSGLLVSHKNKDARTGLDPLIGLIKPKNKTTTHFAENIDDIYLRN